MFWAHEAIFLIVLKLLSEAKEVKGTEYLASADVIVETTSLHIYLRFLKAFGTLISKRD